MPQRGIPAPSSNIMRMNYFSSATSLRFEQAKEILFRNDLHFFFFNLICRPGKRNARVAPSFYFELLCHNIETNFNLYTTEINDTKMQFFHKITKNNLFTFNKLEVYNMDEIIII